MIGELEQSRHSWWCSHSSFSLFPFQIIPTVLVRLMAEWVWLNFTGQIQKKPIIYSVSVVMVSLLKRKAFTVGCSGSDIVSTSVGDLDRLRDQSDVKTVC